MTVRLQNKGQRKIEVTRGNYIAPNQVGIVNEDTAKRLIRLYPEELIDIDNIKASFVEEQVKDLTAVEKPKTPAEIKAEKKAAKEAAEAEAKRIEDEEAQRQLDEEAAALSAAENEGAK